MRENLGQEGNSGEKVGGLRARIKREFHLRNYQEIKCDLRDRTVLGIH